MTSLADQNDKWASYAGPGGYNGNWLKKNWHLTFFFRVFFFIIVYYWKINQMVN